LCVVMFVEQVAEFWERVAIGEIFQDVWGAFEKTEMRFLLK
jgi:hypothetical protein